MTVADRLRAVVDTLPDTAAVTLPVSVLRGWLADEPAPASSAPLAVVEPATWREKLWTCPPDTRLGVREVTEALGRSPDWLYRATNPTKAKEHGREPLPCQKLDGVLVFTAESIRRWLARSERIVNPDSAGPTRQLRKVAP